MMRIFKSSWIVVLVCAAGACASKQEPLTINQIQFIGSHNSYKQAMSAHHMAALRESNPAAARSLDYAHLPLAAQLDLGMRKLEIDVFYDAKSGRFPVGHVQVIDMNRHCSDLVDCLTQVAKWSDVHPDHVPIWISFNAKDDKIKNLPDPDEFNSIAFERMDAQLDENVGDRLIRPAQVMGRNWPALNEARGKLLLILDEQGRKRDLYLADWQTRPMFVNADPDHPAAAVLIINDPIKSADEIRLRVKQGYMVRTRADADTLEARADDTTRREAALASGAQAVSTDYYLPAKQFGTSYQVKIDGVIRCNPVNAPPNCRVSE
jgi:hypothetical protein